MEHPLGSGVANLNLRRPLYRVQIETFNPLTFCCYAFVVIPLCFQSSWMINEEQSFGKCVKFFFTTAKLLFLKYRFSF